MRDYENGFENFLEKLVITLRKIVMCCAKGTLERFSERSNPMNTIPMDARTEAIQDMLIAISVVSRQLAGKIEALKSKAKEAENREQHE